MATTVKRNVITHCHRIDKKGCFCYNDPMSKEFGQVNLPEQPQQSPQDVNRLGTMITKGALALAVLGGASVAEAEPASAECWIEWEEDSQKNLIPIQKCDDEPVTTTPPPEEPNEPNKPKPPTTVVTTPPAVDLDGDGFIESIDHNDNSAFVEGELETVGALPFGEGFLNQTVTNTRGEEVAVRDYLEQAATDSLPDGLQNRLAELIEYGRLQEQMYSANVNADGDSYIAGPNGQFSVTLFEAGLNGGDLEDTMPGSYEPVNQLRLAGINLSDPVAVTLRNGEATIFDSGFMLLNHVGYGYDQFAKDWVNAVDTYNTDKAEQDAAIKEQQEIQEALDAGTAAVEAAAAQAELEAEATNIDNELLPAPQAEELAIGAVGAGNSANVDQEQTGILDNTGWRILLSGGFLATMGLWFANRRIGKRNDELEAKQQAVNGQTVKEPELSDDIVPGRVEAA